MEVPPPSISSVLDQDTEPGLLSQAVSSAAIHWLECRLTGKLPGCPDPLRTICSRRGAGSGMGRKASFFFLFFAAFGIVPDQIGTPRNSLFSLATPSPSFSTIANKHHQQLTLPRWVESALIRYASCRGMDPPPPSPSPSLLTYAIPFRRRSDTRAQGTDLGRAPFVTIINVRDAEKEPVPSRRWPVASIECTTTHPSQARDH